MSEDKSTKEIATQDKTEDEKQKEINQMGVSIYEALAKQILHDLKKKGKINEFFKKYTKADIRRFLENPSQNCDKLHDISVFLYNSSLHYQRLVKYFAKMATLDYIIVPYGIDEKKIEKEMFLKNYKKTADVLENMNMGHEFQKIMTTVFREDVFYGYLHETKDSFYIQKLDYKLCRLSAIEDGVYNFEFDMSYFDKDASIIDTYPEEFKVKHRKYKDSKNSTSAKWQPLDSERTICIKLNEDLLYAIPPMAGLFPALMDIDYFKSLYKAKEELGNYKLISLKIPLKKESDKHNDFMIDGDTAIKYYNMAMAVLPEQVGAILSPMEIEEVDFKRDSVDVDMIEKVTRDYYAESGVSQFLFNSEHGSGVSLIKSIIVDESIVFSLLKQLERWVNRKLRKTNTATYKFKIKILESTYLNKGEMIDTYLKAAQFGVPVKMMLAALMGYSPSDTLSMEFLENDILDLAEKWTPLQSSHVGGNEDGKGRPQSKDDDLGDQGEKTREQEGNDR